MLGLIMGLMHGPNDAENLWKRFRFTEADASLTLPVHQGRIVVLDNELLKGLMKHASNYFSRTNRLTPPPLTFTGLPPLYLRHRATGCLI